MNLGAWTVCHWSQNSSLVSFGFRLTYWRIWTNPVSGAMADILRLMLDVSQGLFGIYLVQKERGGLFLEQTKNAVYS
jgi:hypothetical protein